MRAIIATILAIPIVATGLALILEISMLIGTLFGSVFTTIGGAFTSLFGSISTTIGGAFTSLTGAFIYLTGVIAQLVDFLNPWLILINAINGFLSIIDSMHELFTSLSS